MRTAAEEAVLNKLGLDYTALDAGCCGMAGAFGFEKEHYDVSIKSGERVLLPAVRAASKDTLIIADGFSCREQIAQTTDRRALHLAQVIKLALEEDEKGVTKEDAAITSLQPADQAPSKVGMALIGSIGLMLLGAILWIWGKKKARSTPEREKEVH
jgi:hypothetical protein